MKTIKPVFNNNPKDEAFKAPDYESQQDLKNAFNEAIKTGLDPRLYRYKKPDVAKEGL